MTGNGPYRDARQARQAAHRVIAPEEGLSILSAAQNRMLLVRALEAAGVECGQYDDRIVEWLAGWEDATCMVVAGWVARASQRPEGTATEWGVRFTLGGSVGESAVPDAAGARRAVESMRRNHPDFEPIVMVQREAARPSGPWTPVPEAEAHGD